MLQQPDHQPAYHVDDSDDDAGHRIAAHVFAGAIHRAVELGLARDFGAARARIGFAYQAGIEVGIDRHLLARHCVQRKARADFGDAARALGDDGEVDDGEDHEDDDADRVITADQEVAEGFDHLPCGASAGMALGQHYAGRCHVERQPQHRRHQQHGRKRHEVQRLHGVQAGHQDDDGQRDIEREQQVERERWQRQHHHRQHQDDQRGRGQRLRAAGLHPCGKREAVHDTAPACAASITRRCGGMSMSAGTSSAAGCSARWPARSWNTQASTCATAV